jgi:hypothetical protein
MHPGAWLIQHDGRSITKQQPDESDPYIPKRAFLAPTFPCTGPNRVALEVEVTNDADEMLALCCSQFLTAKEVSADVDGPLLGVGCRDYQIMFWSKLGVGVGGGLAGSAVRVTDGDLAANGAKWKTGDRIKLIWDSSSQTLTFLLNGVVINDHLRFNEPTQTEEGNREDHQLCFVMTSPHMGGAFEVIQPLL